MKEWLNRLVVLIAGDPEEFVLEHRNLNGACFVATCGTLIAVIVNLFSGFSKIFEIIVCITAIIYFLLFYYSRVKKRVKFISVLFLIISILITSISWMVSQGIEGSAAFMVFDLLLISLITFRTQRSLLIILIYNLCLVVLLYIQIYKPSLIIPYVSKTAQLIDLCSGLVTFLLIFSFLVTSLKRNYENERHKVEHQKIEIEKQNKQIQDKNAELEEKQEEINAQKEQLEKINQELIEADEMKSRFFANISHEFKTPLSLIISPLQTLRDNTDNKELKQEYSLMLKHSERLLLLINQLLDISRLEKGKMQLVLQETDISANIRAIASSFISVAKDRNVEFQIIETETNIHGFIDIDKLEKIGYNLLSNAFKFIDNGGKVEVAIKRTENGQKIEFTVKDTGIGIDPEKLPFIFDRFYQVEDGSNRHFEGSGIGLALTKELIVLHKGKIEAASIPSIGSTFIVTLPLDKSVYNGGNVVFIPYKTLENKSIKESDDQDYSSVIKSPSNNELIDRKTVLIVEDNVDMRNHLANSLSEQYYIEMAANGEDGIEMATNLLPDLVLSDVMMPGVDGFQLTSSLKNNPMTCHIPIVLLTAKATDEDKLEGLRFQVDDYITKPFNIKEVIARISSHIINREKLKTKFSKTLTVKPSEITTTSLDEQFIRKALEIIEINMNNPVFSVDDLCREMSMSRTNVHLKLKAITNQSTTEFIRSVRLKRAAQLLKQKAGNISEIADMTGFASVQYFSRSFKEHFKVAPSDY